MPELNQSWQMQHFSKMGQNAECGKICAAILVNLSKMSNSKKTSLNHFPKRLLTVFWFRSRWRAHLVFSKSTHSKILQFWLFWGNVDKFNYIWRSTRHEWRVRSTTKLRESTLEKQRKSPQKQKKSPERVCHMHFQTPLNATFAKQHFWLKCCFWVDKQPKLLNFAMCRFWKHEMGSLSASKSKNRQQPFWEMVQTCFFWVWHFWWIHQDDCANFPVFSILPLFWKMLHLPTLCSTHASHAFSKKNIILKNINFGGECFHLQKLWFAKDLYLVEIAKKEVGDFMVFRSTFPVVVCFSTFKTSTIIKKSKMRWIRMEEVKMFTPTPTPKNTTS